jgi:hypothetical protein
MGPLERANLSHRNQIQFPKCSVLYKRTMDTVQTSSNSECHTPSSEPFRIYQHVAAAFILRMEAKKGRTIAEVISRWLPTTAARVRARI